MSALSLRSQAARLAGAEWVSAHRLLLLVGVCYFLAQLTFFSLSRAPSWDESVYLSQVTPGVRATIFASSRARGITLLVLPLAQAGASLATVRLFLAAASAAALIAAFWVWVGVIGRAAPLAAFLVAFSWLGLFYGSEVMPNLWVALSSLAALGFVARQVVGDGRGRDILVASGLLGVTALFRPPDSLPVAGALALLLLASRRASIRTLFPLTAGLVIGWLPWLIEISIRLGGPTAAFRQAGTVGQVALGPLGQRVLQYLAVTDGPTVGPLLQPQIPPVGALWWGGIGALSMLAVIRSRRAAQIFGPLAIAAVGGIALLIEYVVFVSGIAPRFLFPGYALLAIPSGAGLAYLWREYARSWVSRTATVALITAWATWQGVIADRIEAQAVQSRASYRDVGLVIHNLAGGRQCAVASTDGFPQVAFASGCQGRRFQGDSELREIATRLKDNGYRVFLVLRSPLPSTSIVPSRPLRVPVEGQEALYIYDLGLGTDTALRATAGAGRGTRSRRAPP